VDPARYGATHRHPEVTGVVPEHDRADLAAVRAALELGCPVLAVCRGLQVLNVALGGDIEQHLPDVPGRAPHGGLGAAGAGLMSGGGSRRRGGADEVGRYNKALGA
jgi:gamma-glutamyl-gamma-aminobutyrate hydrolase PuuD